MLHFLRMCFLLVVCTQLLGCFGSTHSPYPDEWSKIQESSNNECNNISGEYFDLDSGRTVSLANLFFEKWYGNKYFKEATHTIIVHSDKTVGVRVIKNQETIQDKTITIGKDFLCAKDGLHISWSKFVFQEGVIGQEKDDFNFLMGEDGSLIVYATSGGFGVYGIFPFSGSQSKYHRFMRYVIK